ncbi:hypothetical protein Tco_1172309 [Tanacetum coccineum]
MGKNTGQKEIRPVWNNVKRINHQNKFVPSAILTRSGRVPVSTAKKSSLRATTSTSTLRPVNTATYTKRVNVSKIRTHAFHKSHSPIRRSFYKPTTPNTRILNEKVNTVRVNGVNTVGQTAVSIVKGNRVTTVKASAVCVWIPKMTDFNNVSKDNSVSWVLKRGNPQQALKNKEIYDSGCSRHMTGNKDFLIDYQDIHGGFVAFSGSARGGKITGKGKIRTYKLDFEDVFFVKELKFNLFSVSQMCDKKNNVLFTETECLVLSPDFKILDASQVLLRVPRQSNMYSFDLKNVVPSGDLTCLFAKATIDESERVLEKPNEPPLSEGHTSGSGEGSMEHTFELMDTVLPTPHDSPLTGGYTPKGDEGRLKLKELMAICTKLSKQVFDLEKEKDAQAVEILKLK